MIKLKLLSALMLIVATVTFAQEKRISVHDPVMIKQDDTYYLFCTGRGISMISSTDLKTWKNEKPVFQKIPEWTFKAVEGFRGHMWAPDISFYKGKYYLFYSVSAFGKNTSCIGVASTKTLHTDSPDYGWEDHGLVIQSFPDSTNWNAIDPNLIIDEKGKPWLSYGSFWDGLQLVKLKDDLTGPAKGQKPVTFCSRKPDPKLPNPPSIDNNPVNAGGNAVEAPFIYKKGKYYYLFASFDYCCKGLRSNYKIAVGRSKKVQGPYLDKEGKSMRNGGGTIFMQGDADWSGLGHNAVVNMDNGDYIIFHAYDVHENGQSKLRIFQLGWDKDGWPFADKAVY